MLSMRVKKLGFYEFFVALTVTVLVILIALALTIDGTRGILLLLSVFIGVGLLVVGAIRPYLILRFLVLTMIGLNSVKFGGGKLSLDVVLNVYASLLFALELVKNKPKIDKSSRLFFGLFFFTLLSAIPAQLVSPIGFSSWSVWIRWLTYLIIMVYVYQIEYDEKLRIMLLIRWSGIISSLWAVADHFLHIGIPEQYGSTILRAAGPAVYPNFLAFFLLVPLIIAISSSMKYSSKLLLVEIVIYLLGIYFTLTRSALYVALFLIGYWLFRRGNKLTAITTILLLVIFFVFLGDKGGIQRIVQGLNVHDYSHYGSMYWRFLQWNQVWKIYLTHPFVGNGFHSVEYFTTYAPHNEYLGLLAECGVSFFVLFFLANVVLLRKLYEVEIAKTWLPVSGLMIFFSLAVTSLTDNTFSVPSSIFYYWVILSVLISKDTHNKKLV